MPAFLRRLRWTPEQITWLVEDLSFAANACAWAEKTILKNGSGDREAQASANRYARMRAAYRKGARAMRLLSRELYR